MSPRWSWDFEDERRPGADREGPHGQPPETPLDPAAAAERIELARFRRRRGVGAIVVLLMLAVILVAISGGSSHSSQRRHPKPTKVPTHKAPVRRPVVPGPATVAGGDAAVRRVRAYTPFVREGGARGHDIALTFDDGPGPYTPQLLSVLERFHVHATFFEIGRMLRYFSASTEREIADGDVVGDHTEDHPALAQLSAHDQYEELFEDIARLEIAGSPRPLLFRPPHGSYDATTMRELARLHLLMVLWSDDTDDYEQPGVSTIVARALEGAHPGAIILMHDAGGDRSETIAALPRIIRTLRRRGFRLVTVPQLLAEDPPPHGLPLPHGLTGD